MGEILRSSVITAYILLGLTLLTYQNCAPSADSLQQAPVDVIDPISVGGISFPQNKVSAFTSESLIVNGLCEQTGALISWKLLDLEGQLIERGLSECDLGAFAVEVSSSWQSRCGESLMLEAALGAKSTSQTEVEVNCQ